MSYRIEKINSSILRKIIQVIPKMGFLPKDLMFTITRVETTKDLGYTKIFYSVMPDHKRKLIKNLIRKNERKITTNLFRAIPIHPFPKIIFLFDENLAKKAHIDELFTTIDE